MARILFVLFMCAQILGVSASATESTSWIGHIYDLKQRRFITEPMLFDALRRTRYILIGEKHDNETHHRIEADLVRGLAAQAISTSVIMEMLQPMQESKLRANAALRGEALRDAIGWNDKAWPWKVYGPVVEAALNSEVALYAGNLEKETLLSVYREGALPVDSIYDTVPMIGQDVRDNLLDTLYTEHCGAMAREKLKPMLLIQLARDAAMANALVTPEGTRSVLISGAYHTSRLSGVPLHLAQRDALAATAVIWLVEASHVTDIESLNVYGAEADYLWITPDTPVQDYCADIKRVTNG